MVGHRYVALHGHREHQPLRLSLIGQQSDTSADCLSRGPDPDRLTIDCNLASHSATCTEDAGSELTLAVSDQPADAQDLATV
jgi:hypothetical protein